MANYTIIGGDGKQYGPVTSEELRRWLAENRINSRTQVLPEGSTLWQPLADIPEFGEWQKNTAPPALPASAAAPAAAAKTSALAITALVLGLLGLFTCGITALAGLVLGIVAFIKIKNSGGELKGNGLAIAGIIVSAIFLLMIPIFAGMLLPALSTAKGKAQQISCLNNEKQLALAVKIFSSDSTNHYPHAATWCDDIKTYVGMDQVFKCPAANPANRCSYAFNAKLDGLDEDKVDPQTVMIFESDAGWNAHGGPELLPASARHGRGGNKIFIIAFADGHVEAVTQSRLGMLRWNP